MYKINFLIFPETKYSNGALKGLSSPTVINNSIYKKKTRTERPLKQTLGLKIIKYISIRRFYGKHPYICICCTVLFKDFK